MVFEGYVRSIKEKNISNFPMQKDMPQAIKGGQILQGRVNIMLTSLHFNNCSIM